MVQYGLIPRDRLATLEPALILPCATAYEAGSPELAVAGFRDLLVRYPHSREAPTATLHLARLIFTTKTAREPADYAPPAPYKTDPSLGSSAVLTVYNGTIQPLAVTVVGPEGAVFQVIPPCTTCQVYDNDAEARCSYSSPHITVKIPAGRHGLDIWYTRSEFRLRGLWTARSSKAYRDCFFQTR